MNEILLNILSVVVTSIILPLLTYAGTRLIAYLNSKIKDDNYRIQLTTATDIVVNAVRSVFQTYVDSLKVSGNFDKEAQLIALNKAKDIALEQMTDDVKNFISKNHVLSCNVSLNFSTNKNSTCCNICANNSL